MTYLKKIILVGLFFELSIYPNNGFAQQTVDVIREVVNQHQVMTPPSKKKQFTQQEIKEIKAAKEVVKKYWISSYKDVYGLLSNDYKEGLKKAQQINNAEEYVKAFSPSERVWLRQTYEKVNIQNNNFMQIIVTADWEEEGYEGVMTYIFDMAKEDGNWKIYHIMF
jgi:hypothetical protein